ncbi:MAG: DUF1365 domain-containing protein [Xanthomonadales bacterium]|nr:DUF1365 domain-containing protein [Xanthomonadales bacterium]
MNSAIYTGTIRHRRFRPVEHTFQYRMFMLYLDLAELDTVFERSRLFSAQGRAAAEFRRSDHLGDPAIPLDQSVRDLVEVHTGSRPAGPVCLLTHLRYFGYVFNPVSFYYCFDQDGSNVETIVAEVNNTPWGEQYCYVLPVDDPRQGLFRFGPEKEMHVSPFMPMDIEYDWRFATPGNHLNVHMSNLREGEKVFDATLRLERRTLSPSSLARSLAAYPFVTLRVMVAIHWQALRLWLKKCPVYDHPDKHRRPAALREQGR